MLKKTLLALGLGLSLLFCGAPQAQEGPVENGTPAEPVVFRAELETLNRTFTDLQSGFVPVDRGGVTILLRSPSHRLTVHSHRLTLRTVPEDRPGTYDVWLTVELDGEGDLEATVRQTGTELKDKVVAPRQTVRVSSRLRLQSAEGGFLLEVVKSHLPTLDFQIESRLAGQIVASCSGLGVFLGGLDCDALEAALGVAKVSMPPAGERFWLPAERMTEADRALLSIWAAPMPTLDSTE